MYDNTKKFSLKIINLLIQIINSVSDDTIKVNPKKDWLLKKR